MRDHWKFDTCGVTVQYTENIAVFETSSEIINIGAASNSLMPLNYLYRGIRLALISAQEKLICWLANVAFFPPTTLTSALKYLIHIWARSFPRSFLS